VSEKLAAFRTDRLSKILNDEIPVRIKESAKIIFHLLPLSSFSSGYSVDLKSIASLPGFEPMHVSRGYGSQHNFDGCCVFESFPSNFSLGYTQVFRSGCIETVDSRGLGVDNDKKLIFAKAYREKLIEYLPKLLMLEKHLGVTPPFVAALSLINVRDYNMFTNSPWGQTFGSHPIDRDHLLMPEILLEDFDCDIAKLLKPAFDAIYNACGYAES
jgi:hypothetical protein